jgi:hypothetical protein
LLCPIIFNYIIIFNRQRGCWFQKDLSPENIFCKWNCENSLLNYSCLGLNNIGVTQLSTAFLQPDDFSFRAVGIPEPEEAQKAADVCFVFFVGYGLDCKLFGLCVVCLFGWRRVIGGVYYTVCKIATTCCDEQRSSEQAVIEIIFFHESAF